MFSKSDTKFAAMAADPAKRHAMVASRQLARTGMFWCALVITVCDLATAWTDGHFAAVMSTATLIQWMLVLKFDSDVRMLSIVDTTAKRSVGETIA